MTARILLAYIRFGLVCFVTGFGLMMLFTRPIETVLYAAAGLCAGAIIWLVIFGAKLEAKIRDGERTKVSSQAPAMNE